MTEEAAVNDAPHVLIVGAGIAGIAAALRLRRLAPDCDITLVDAALRFGGKIDGEIVAGCVVDGGADVCIGKKLRATAMFTDLQFADRVIRVNPDGLDSFEKRDGKLVPAATRFTDELLTFREGMREIVDAACAALDGVRVLPNTKVATLEADGTKWKADSETGSHTADAVILALPASEIATLLAGIAPKEAAAIGTLEYPPTTTVSMAWHAADIPRPLDGTGYVVADPEAVVSACTWTSAKIPSHATTGTLLVRGYVRGVSGGSAAVLQEVSAVLGVRARPLFTRTYEWPMGIPVYTPEHESNVRALELALAPLHSIFLAGSAFHGVGIPDCIASGERAASAAVNFLSSRTGGSTA